MRALIEIGPLDRSLLCLISEHIEDKPRVDLLLCHRGSISRTLCRWVGCWCSELLIVGDITHEFNIGEELPIHNRQSVIVLGQDVYYDIPIRLQDLSRSVTSRVV